jgi:hypothetical protein
MLVFTGKIARNVMKKQAKLPTIWAVADPAQNASSAVWKRAETCG